MRYKRKRAREFLLSADRKTFLNVVYGAKVSPRQKEILYKKFLDGFSNTKISMEMFISVETVRRELSIAYDLLFNYLNLI